MPHAFRFRNSRTKLFLLGKLTLRNHSGIFPSKGDSAMLRALVAVLLILWLLGFVLHLAGSIIHALAVVALIVLVYDLVTRKRAGN